MHSELNKDLVVVALGGNAILKKGEKGDIHNQFANTRESMDGIIDLLEKNYRMILTHGNGPQVGNIMVMADRAKDILPETPLGIADAMTCGSMGYMIEQCLQDEMIKRKLWRNVVTLPAQIAVDRNDPSLKNPSKPIGPFYEKEEADRLGAEKGWVMKEDAGRGYRRYVPSPYPVDIVEKKAIKLLLENDYVVITGGGGGIPVYFEENGTIEGVDCVIDKDLASMKLALAVEARLLVIITGVPHVSINWGRKDEKALNRMTLAEARYHLADGQFPAGSMGPKMAAAIEFLQANPQNRVLITDVENLSGAMDGNGGTLITSL